MYDKETVNKIYGMFVNYHYCTKEKEHTRSFLYCYSKICAEHRLMLINLGWTYLAGRENKKQ